MKKQYVVNVDTTQNGAAVQVWETSANPVTIPPSPVPISMYDGAREALEPLEDAINYALLEAVRG